MVSCLELKEITLTRWLSRFLTREFQQVTIERRGYTYGRNCLIKDWNWAELCRALRYKSFLCPTCFLFVGNRLHSGSMIFLEFQRQVQTVTNQGREGKQSKNNSAGLVQGHISSVRNVLIHNNIFELYCRTKGPARWRMATSGWRKGSWSISLLPHNQPIRRKSHNLQKWSEVTQSCPTLPPYGL